jgi:hypothetical protein
MLTSPELNEISWRLAASGAHRLVAGDLSVC